MAPVSVIVGVPEVEPKVIRHLLPFQWIGDKCPSSDNPFKCLENVLKMLPIPAWFAMMTCN